MSVKLYREGSQPIEVPKNKVASMLEMGWSKSNAALGFSKARAAAQAKAAKAEKDAKSAQEAAETAAKELARKNETKLTLEAVDRAVRAANYAKDCADAARKAADEAIAEYEKLQPEEAKKTPVKKTKSKE